MRRGVFFASAMVAAFVGMATFGSSLVSGQAATPQPGQVSQGNAPAVPKPIEPAAPFVPEGFTAIFNGRDLTGWHISSTNHHGTTPAYRVMHGHDRRHAESSRPGGHPPDGQEIQERRSLHGSEARLRLRQRLVPAIERGRRSLSGHAGLSAWRRHGWHLWRAPDGCGRARKRARSARAAQHPRQRHLRLHRLSAVFHSEARRRRAPPAG